MPYILILLMTLLISFSLQAQSLLFQITGNNLEAPSYLFGTIHLTSNSKTKSYQLATKKLRECKSYAMEINPNDFDQVGILNKLMIPNGKTIKDFISNAEYDSLSARFYAATGMSYVGFEQIQPIFLIALMNQGNKSKKESASTPLMMDIALAKLAEKKMKVYGLETIEEQLEALSEFPIKEQVQQLIENQTNEVSLEDSLYKLQDIDKIYEATTAKMTMNQVKTLITDRNTRMAERAVLLLQKESIFIAVGAAHLGGENGLVHQLRKRGFQLKEIVR